MWKSGGRERRSRGGGGSRICRWSSGARRGRCLCRRRGGGAAEGSRGGGGRSTGRPVEAPETTGEAAMGVEDREAEGVGREGLGGGWGGLNVEEGELQGVVKKKKKKKGSWESF
ncbi:hypothetical protein ACLB2K_010932 [Fragaria x ananassa]